MAVQTSEQLDNLLTRIRGGECARAYLIIGERFLSQQAADSLCHALLAGGGIVHPIDGDQEPFATTLHRLTSFSLFPGRQIYRVTNTRLLHSVKVAESLWKKAARARQNNEPDKAAQHLQNMLESAGLKPDDPENDPGRFSPAQWKKMFGFAQPQEDLGWTGSLLNAFPAQPQETSARSVDDPAALLEQKLVSGIPGQNILILTAEEVDRRKRLYKYLAENQVVVDLSVESGSSSRAQSAQKKILLELVHKTLAGFGKIMLPAVAEQLIERVGFHPVAVVMETEKLALYAGDSTRIVAADLESLVGRTRQEALYELTDALGKRDLEKCLLVAGRLVEYGIHPLAMIATLKNYVRTLLLFRALQDQPENGYYRSMPQPAFQQQVLPRLKENEEWKQELSGHPYALYMQFKTAAEFPLSTLRRWLEQVLAADFRLKGSTIAQETTLQYLLLSMLVPDDKAVLQKNSHALPYRNS
ncbi:MAG TPA: DNA polymerase III subunit delta [Desulfobulbaceae bacterium]|nr:DNA polymerase III subunit delta [Desulfobulbaceae bacterium]